MIDFFELRENYRALAVKGMGTETKKDARVGLELDYYDGSGTKRSGKITKVGPKSYIVKDDKDGKNRQFLFHDRAKAKEILAKNESVELDESLDLEERKEPVKVPRAVFDKLKKGSLVDLDWDGSMSSGAGAFKVVSKSRSAKYDVDKIKLAPTNGKKTVPFYLYSRKGGDATLAIGDMGASLTKYKVVKESVELEENKIFFVKVGDGRDSMTVKVKADTKGAAVKKMKAEYPKRPVSLDRNQKQGNPAGAFESVEESVKTEDKGQFIYAAKQAKAKGDSTFVFAGKTYNCEEVLGELSAKLLDKAAKKADDESDKSHHAKDRKRAGKKYDQATKFHKGAKDSRRRAIRRGEKDLK